MTDSAAQTDADMLSPCGPDCEARFEVKLRDFRARIERELNDQMQVAMRNLEERVCADTHSYMIDCSFIVMLCFGVTAQLVSYTEVTYLGAFHTVFIAVLTQFWQ